MNHVNLTSLKASIPYLLALFRAKQDAAEMYTAGINAVSKKTFADKSALRKAITALSKDKHETVKEEADELSEMLVELQEFAGTEE